MRITDRLNRLLKKNKYTLPILQGLGVIALITAISVISVRLLTGDTISDYADANPDIAYAPIPISEQEMQYDKDKDEDEDTDEDTDNADIPEVSAIPVYNRSVMIRFYEPDVDQTGRYVYEQGFYYEPLNEDMIRYITGTSYPDTGSDPDVSYEELRYVGVLHIDFNGLTQAGELICHESIAQDLVDIFYELYVSDYRIDSIYLIDNFGGDDTVSMAADNTSCFNYRVVEGSSSLSKHAYGMAIDINPFYNPYIVFGAGEGGSDYISPAGSEIYADRSRSFAYKIDENDLCYRLFKEHGFIWGGDWNSCKDYQHFQKTPKD